MAKDPAFLFYSDNFQSGTQFLSDEQTGKYIRLLCAQHLHGHLEEKHMLFICKTYDFEIWCKFAQDGDGKYYNERLEIEILKRLRYSDSRSTNRKSTTSNKKTPKNISSTYDNHMGNGIGNENGIENTDGNGKLLVAEMFRVFSTKIPNYPGSTEKDSKPLFSIAKFFCKVGKLHGSPELHKDEVLIAWESVAGVIAEDNFYKQKSLSTISNHIQELTQIALHGKSNGKPDYGSKERASEYDRLFVERYGKGGPTVS